MPQTFGLPMSNSGGGGRQRQIECRSASVVGSSRDDSLIKGR